MEKNTATRKTKRSIQDRFDEFNENHPEVYDYFEQFTMELIEAGNDRGGARQVVERIRWEYAVNEERDEKFKVNDNFISRYARLFMALHPELAGFFEIRKLRDVREESSETQEDGVWDW